MSPEARKVHETKFRVRYGETDAQGIVNNSNYLSYFEVGRVEWLRAAGLSYRDMERAGYGFVVVEAHAFYKRAARFDDDLTLKTTLADFSKASFWFEYEVLREGEVVATGRTRHGCIEISTGRPSRVPKEFVARFSGGAA